MAATPPVFDGAEDLNGRRNHDELAFWLNRLPDQAFVLAGNLNIDAQDSEGRPEALTRLMAHVTDPEPRSKGGAAAKGGVNALTASLAMENTKHGIRINATAPGATEAPPRLIPRNSAQQSEQEQAWYRQIYTQSVDSSLMKRYGTLDEQAEPILFLASDDASYITGTVLPVGGGDQG